ncbi:hypothetical protein HPGCJGGD_3435 [Methylobacterium haplocladii]|nr:hypothetical protein HPGCJGGD_3435 [Methylobacterium haplocladii]
MPTLKRFDQFKICVFADDHPPPHFHVIGRGFKATILFETLSLDVGECPRKVFAEAVTWAAVNREALEEAWRNLNERS